MFLPKSLFLALSIGFYTVQFMLNRFPLPVSLIFLCLLGAVGVVSAQQISVPVYDNFSDLEARLKQAGDTLLVVNFWATWCGPCVAELPHFQTLEQKFPGKQVRVILVSLDLKTKMEKTLLPFLEDNSVQSETLLLADSDADTWIPKVDASWQGGIPATWLIRGAQRRFNKEVFAEYSELEDFVQSFRAEVLARSDFEKR
jgi:thiol-disulfide isomerase/thioredoxin